VRLKVIVGGVMAVAVSLGVPGVAGAQPSLCGFQVCYDETLPGGANVNGSTGVMGSGPHVGAGTDTEATAGGGTANTRGGVGSGGSGNACAGAGTTDGQNRASAAGAFGTLGIAYAGGSAGVVADGTPAGAQAGQPTPPNLPYAGPAPPPGCTP
jgi:hypothetical protein